MAVGHSRLITKEDVINPLLDYFKIKLEKLNLNNLRELAFQILLREEKELEKEGYKLYRKIILKERKKYASKKN